MSPNFNTGILLTVALAASQVAAHMQMSFPPPLRSTFNPNTAQGSADYSYTAPLAASGSDFPCKGYLNVLGTPQGKSVATFAPGQKYNFTVTGGANHNGGSCQASLSYDQGKTFTVIASYVGGCPPAGTSSWDFTVPDDARSGAAVFAWTWFNQVGNREMYMNCASVTISGGSTSGSSKRSGTAFSARPGIFVANVGNGCSTPEGFDYEFPNPGPNVVTKTGGKTIQLSCGAKAAPPPPAENTPAAPAPAADPAATEYPLTVIPIYSTFSPASPTSNAANVSTMGPTSPSSVATTPTPNAENSPPAPSAADPSPATPPTLQTATPATGGPVDNGTGGASSVPQAAAAAGGGAYAAGTACADEGAWNCIAGASFQRCASGAWSAAQNMAAGTRCAPGVSDTLVFSRRVRRGGHAGRAALDVK